jgi:hypothetical protein
MTIGTMKFHIRVVDRFGLSKEFTTFAHPGKYFYLAATNQFPTGVFFQDQREVVPISEQKRFRFRGERAGILEYHEEL